MGATALFLMGSVCLVITVQARDCSRPLGNPNTRLSDRHILLQTFPDGTRVSFVCEVGYSHAGGSTAITCTAGVWSTLKRQCKRKNCGSLGEVPDGFVDYPEGTQFGDKAVISCNDGFTLVGKKEITCGDKGWADRLPTCEEVFCREIELPTTTAASTTTTTTSNTPLTSKKPTGSVDPTPPKGNGNNNVGLIVGVLVEVTCESPPVVTDATFSPDKEIYGYREIVNYTCKSGYTLTGTTQLFCSDRGFTPDPPTCVKIQCCEPNVANAEWAGGSYAPYGYLSTVTYRCRPGYKMNGESTLKCGINSQWLPRIPTCERVQCYEPNVANADWSGGSYSPYGYLSTVTYKCNSGYKMNGEPTLTCGINSQWLPRIPTCEKVQCYEPNVANGEWLSGSRPPYGYLSTVTYRCRPGYKMNGEPTLTCGINSQWLPRIPTCENIEA